MIKEGNLGDNKLYLTPWSSISLPKGSELQSGAEGRTYL